jgi:hypothetical protein
MCLNEVDVMTFYGPCDNDDVRAVAPRLSYNTQPSTIRDRDRFEAVLTEQTFFLLLSIIVSMCISIFTLVRFISSFSTYAPHSYLQTVRGP